MANASIGLLYPVFAPLDTHTDGSMPTYKAGRVIQEARGASITYEYNDNPLYGDNRIVDEDNGMTGLTIEFESTGLNDDDRRVLFGEDLYGTSGAQWVSDSETPYGGFAYIRRMRNAGERTYEAWLILKVKFTETRQETRTQEGDQITWGTPTISGRGASLDVDGSGKLRYQLHQTFETISAAKTWINTMLNVSAATT
jgi:phi13 family phage major tail protein